MKDRKRLLVIAVAVIAGYYVLETVVVALWLKPWNETGVQIAAAQKDLDRARLLKRDRIEKGWKDLKARLEVKRLPDVENHFFAHLDALCDRVSANPDSRGGTTQQQGDFKEYSYDMTLKLSWSQFGYLLDELANSKELLKPLRISLGSADKEERMTVDLKVSTLAWSPAPAKGGSK